jgi:AbrB family looped-hinge helix DNA binding protein
MKGVTRYCPESTAMTASRLRLGENGRISLPAAYRRQLGFRPGDELIVRLEDGAISVTSPKLAIERARRILSRYIKTKESLADSLIADRRAEAARE